MEDNKPTTIEEILNEILNDVSKFGIDIVRPRLNYYVKEINELKIKPILSNITLTQPFVSITGGNDTTTSNPSYVTTATTKIY